MLGNKVPSFGKALLFAKQTVTCRASSRFVTVRSSPKIMSELREVPDDLLRVTCRPPLIRKIVFIEEECMDFAQKQASCVGEVPMSAQLTSCSLYIGHFHWFTSSPGSRSIRVFHRVCPREFNFRYSSFCVASPIFFT